jgi:hypothetical protein
MWVHDSIEMENPVTVLRKAFVPDPEKSGQVL